VHALRAGVAKHLPRAHRFVCLTDMDVPGVETIPLEHDWPGWWAKPEIWRPGVLQGPCLYLDLDTLPVGDLSDIASYRGPFAMLNDFFQGRKLAASGVMAWTPGPHTEAIYEAMLRERRIPPGRSDHWYARHAPEAERLQELHPGQLVSLKAHAKDGPPENARLVSGHGKPRLSDPKAGWAYHTWKERVR
jgi:hypothetical protein